ncbi:MAG: hypothetical protein RL148_253 [Planctomycetota bacterium]|jgi:uncharacterized lipoprotein YddW (UPF0748 family)
MRALATALLLAAGALAQSPEVRAVWIARDGLVSRAKISSTLDALAAANFNVVCVNVWSRGYTIHPSDVMQRVCGARQDPSFVGRDPLQETITEAHRRGIEVEAWFEYGFVGGWSGWYPVAGDGPVLAANPTWAAADQTGTCRVSDGGTGWFSWLSHENPQVQQFLVDLSTEVVDRYDVDGVQWDRFRYPSTAFGYDAATVAAYGSAPPTNVENTAWKRWRADRLNAFVARVYSRTKERRPSVRITNAPVVMNTSYDLYLQDWPWWVRNGALDLSYFQCYRTTASSYITTLDANLALFTTAQRAKLAPGIRAITGTPTTEVLAMVAANRARGLPGHAFWYAEGLYDDLPSLTSQYFQAPAPVPGRTSGWRSAPVVREETDPSTLATAGWTPLAATNASAGAHLAATATTTDESVEFVLPVQAPGLYRVLAHQATAAGRATQVPHEVVHAQGTHRVTTNQFNALGNGWTELGTYWLDPAAGPCRVRVHSVRNQQVAADAASLLPSRLAGSSFTSYGAGTAGAGGVPPVSLRGNSGLGGSVEAQTRALPSGTLAMYVLGGQRAQSPLLGGILLTQPLTTVLTTADTTGTASTRIAIPFLPSLRNMPIQVQCLAVDSAAPAGVSMSPGAEFTLF